MAHQNADNTPETSLEEVWASIIIVNFNAGEFLQKAVDSLARQSDQDFELIIVDNDSTDGSMEGLNTDHIARKHLVAAGENTGFAKGNNIGAQHAQGKWILFLNPDAEADPDWLSQFRQATRTFPQTVIFGGSTISTLDPTRLDGAGDCYFILGLPWRGGYTRPIEELPGIGECFSPCAASAMVRRDIFLSIGGFDERYFCYCEDVDLGFRLRLLGHRPIFWPEARALHYGSGTTSVGSAFSVRLGTRNRFWMFVKDMPPVAFWLLLPGHILITLALLVRSVMTGRTVPTVQGLWDGLKGLGPILADRRSVQSQRKASSLDLMKAMSWNWWRVRHRKTDIRPIDIGSKSAAAMSETPSP